MRRHQAGGGVPGCSLAASRLEVFVVPLSAAIRLHHTLGHSRNEKVAEHLPTAVERNRRNASRQGETNKRLLGFTVVRMGEGPG